MLTERCARVSTKPASSSCAKVDAFEEASSSPDPLALVRANRELHDSINRHADNCRRSAGARPGRPLVEALRVRFGFDPGGRTPS
jgi:hypothetical protein